MKKSSPFLLGVLVILAGCKGPAEPPVASAPAMPKELKDIEKGLVSNVDAGVPVAASIDNKKWQDLQKTKVYPARLDPFALQGEEAAFDKAQFAGRMFDAQRFNLEADPQNDAPTQDLSPEPQPYRRLTGILVGDTVVAIIEFEPGKPARLIRPGQQIGEWRVISIDTEKATLRRRSVRPPQEIQVKLEGKPVVAAAPPVVANPGGGNPGGGGGGRGNVGGGGGRTGGGGGGAGDD